jgi:hypothetical protein
LSETFLGRGWQAWTKEGLMSFTPADGSTDSSIDVVIRSLLQHDSLPFTDALTVEQIQQAFDDEGVSFGDADSDRDAESDMEDDGVVYTMGVTLWAMLSQALFTDVLRSCRAAVQRVAVYYALSGVEVSSTNTGAYCRARAKIPEGVVKRLTEGVAERCEAHLPVEELWMGLRAYVARSSWRRDDIAHHGDGRCSGPGSLYGQRDR